MSKGIALRIFNLATRWMWVVSFTPRPLYPQGKSPWYPLDRRLGGSQSRSGHGSEEKNPRLLRELNPRTPIVQSVAQRYTDWAITVLGIIWYRFIYSQFWTRWRREKFPSLPLLRIEHRLSSPYWLSYRGSGLHKGGGFIDQLRDYWLHKGGSAPWRYCSMRRNAFGFELLRRISRNKATRWTPASSASCAWMFSYIWMFLVPCKRF
jgi:hypothetical protein